MSERIFTSLSAPLAKVPATGLAIPNSPSKLPLGVAFLQHAASIPGLDHVLTDRTGRRNDKLGVHVLARAAVEMEVCIGP